MPLKTNVTWVALGICVGVIFPKQIYLFLPCSTPNLMIWWSRESVNHLAVLINISTVSISSYLFHSKQHIIDLFKVLVKSSCLNTEECKFASSEYRCLNINVRILSTDSFSRSKFMTSSNWNNLKIQCGSCNRTCRHGNEIPCESATYLQL